MTTAQERAATRSRRVPNAPLPRTNEEALLLLCQTAERIVARLDAEQAERERQAAVNTNQAA